MALNPPIVDWSDKVVWVLGASSGIGLATAQALCERGARVAVSARNAQSLEAFTQSNPKRLALPLDVDDLGALRRAVGQIESTWGRLDLVMFCPAHYRANRATRYDLSDMLLHQQVNYVGMLKMLEVVLGPMVAAGRGHISLVGSVAAYRGLPKSLAYGPTKAAMSNLADCLYLDLHDSGVAVSLINPGFVQTPLTAQNKFRMPALITPAQAAQAILKGWAKGHFEIHFPKRFTLWLRLLRMLPDSWYFWLIRRMLT